MTKLDRNGKTRQTKNVNRGDQNRNAEGNTGSLEPSAISGRGHGFIKVSVDREDSEGSPSVRHLSSIIGGTLRHLITQLRNQVANKLDDIRRIEDEVEQLNAQINELAQLLQTLENSLESQNQE